MVNYLGRWTDNSLVLNLVEGLLRMALFIAYVLAIRNMQDIKTLFRYHGAEHKTIHCLCTVICTTYVHLVPCLNYTDCFTLLTDSSFFNIKDLTEILI